MQLVPMFVIIPAVAAVLIVLAARRQPRLADALATIATLAVLAMALAMLGKSGVYWLGGQAPQGGVPTGIGLVLDKVSAVMLATVGLVGLMATLYSTGWSHLGGSKANFYGLLLAMIAGLNGTVLAGDLLLLYIFIEIASLAGYVLAAGGYRETKLTGPFRYLVVSAIGSALIWVALGVTYKLAGSLNMAQVGKVLGDNPTSLHLAAAGLFLAGFAIKSGIFPFHLWLVDEAGAASPPVAAVLLAVAVEVVGVYAMARVLFNALGVAAQVQTLLMVLGTIAILVGALMALREKDIRRILAWHTASEIGFIVLALGIGSRPAIAAVLVYIVTHAVYKSLLVLNAGSMARAAGAHDLAGLGGVTRGMPVTGATWTIGSLSISAIPPFGGFWSRFFVIVAVIQVERYGYAAWAIAGSILTLASFARIQAHLSHDARPEAREKAKEVPALMQVPVIVLAVLAVVTGLLWLPQVQERFFMEAAKIIQEGVTYGSSILGG